MTTAVVVGSGPNGLAAAIRLAQDGLEVTVVEAYERPGGGTRTSELTLPGLLHDDCAAFHPTGVASPFFQSLGLERHGLRWLWPEVDLAHPLDDGRAGLAARDLSITDESLGVDAARWRRMFDAPIRGFDDLISEVFQPVVHLPSHPVTLARFGTRALMPATWTAGQFKDDPARALFMGVAAHSFSQLTTPLSSSVGLLLTAAAHAVGWPVAEGGTESITRALLAELAELGGTVVTDTRVQSLDGLADLVGSAPDVVMLDTVPPASWRSSATGCRPGFAPRCRATPTGRPRSRSTSRSRATSLGQTRTAAEPGRCTSGAPPSRSSHPRPPRRAVGCLIGRSSCSASSTSSTRPDPWEPPTRCMPTPTCRTAMRATRPTR